MTKASDWLPERRGWTAKQTAHYIGFSDIWFAKNKDDLIEKWGFPEASPATGKYDGKKVALWYDEHSGLLKKDANIQGSEGWQQGLDALANERAKPAA